MPIPLRAKEYGSIAPMQALVVRILSITVLGAATTKEIGSSVPQLLALISVLTYSNALLTVTQLSLAQTL